MKRKLSEEPVRAGWMATAVVLIAARLGFDLSADEAVVLAAVLVAAFSEIARKIVEPVAKQAKKAGAK